MEALALPAAADACFTWRDHLDLAGNRIRRLMTMQPASEVEDEAHALVMLRLAPLWSRLEDQVLRGIEATRLAEPLPRGSSILSPSDFGFHNTLEEQGSLVFLDFEYAGWDDPAKLICDFTCQPELPVSDSQGRQFGEEIVRAFPHPGAVAHRVEQLLPVHRLKWCCILLNEFRAEDRSRRIHAGVEPEGLLAGQLGKAREYFDRHLAQLE